MKRGRKNILKYSVIIILSVLAIIILAFLIYMNFFYFKKCQNQSCFEDYLSECRRGEFTISGDMIMGYKIEGKRNNQCIIEVEFLKGDISNQDAVKLAGKKMKCSLPFGVVALPDSNLELCEGALKEELQSMIITKLHSYIVENINEINSGG